MDGVDGGKERSERSERSGGGLPTLNPRHHSLTPLGTSPRYIRSLHPINPFPSLITTNSG